MVAIVLGSGVSHLGLLAGENPRVQRKRALN